MYTEDDNKKKIEQYKTMYTVCINMLEFKHNSEHKKGKLREYRREILESGNKNRIGAAERLVKSATYDTAVNITETLAKVLGVKETDRKISEYSSLISALRKSDPKEYLVECLKGIARCKKDIVVDYTYVHKSTKPQLEVSPHTNTSSITTHEESKIGLSLKEIIKRHLEYNNPYLDEREVQAIKREFKVSENKRGYLSDDTIKKLFMVRIVNEKLNKHEEVKIKGIVDSMDALYKLALTEMGYNPINHEFEKMLNAINYVKDRDYVEEYAKLYVKVQEASSKFSKDERDLLREYIKASDLMKGRKELPTPEEFRQKVNETAVKNIDWVTASNNNFFNITYNISRYTRYMTPEELAEYYHTLQSNSIGYNPVGLQSIFVNIIERRMKPMDDDMTDEERFAETEIRHNSICAEYLNEKLINAYNSNLAIPNYAKTNIELNEAEKRKAAGKLYFRDSKTRSAIGKMKFKRIQDIIKLSSLSKQGTLTDKEVEEVRRLF